MRGSMRRQRGIRWYLMALVLLATTFAAHLGQLTAAAPSDASATSAALAKDLIKRAGIDRGICVVLGRDGDLPLQLVRSSQFLTHVRDPKAAFVSDLRKQADAAGFNIRRLAAEQGRLDKLPYAENMVDLVVATRVAANKLDSISMTEILRVLRPLGTAIIGVADQVDADDGDLQKLKKWAQSGGGQNVSSLQNEFGTWVQFTKPPIKGVDDWRHWEKGPDNNPVSSDAIIKAPYMTQFMGKPYYIGMPSITTAAGGRTFLAIGHIAHHEREWGTLNKLIARNGYNGTVLWERKLPEGYLVHRSAFIATKDTYYMIDGGRCLLLDPQTGAEKGEIRIPGIDGEWKWMVLKDSTLFVLAGKKDPGAQIMKGDRSFGGWSWSDLSKGYYQKPRVPWGFGQTLAAYDIATKKVVWKHTEKNPIDSRGMTMGKEKLMLYCPDAHLRCLNIKSGDILWTNKEKSVLALIEEPGKGLTSTPGFRTACLSVFTPDAVIIQGQTRMNVVAISTSDGYLLWKKKKVTNNPNAIYVDGKIVLGVGPGGSHVVVDPETGNVLEDLKFRKVACTRLTASTDSFFCRGEGMLRFDRKGKQSFVDGAVRPACNDGALPANGLLYLGPWQCDCNLSLIGRVAKCSAGKFRFDYVATDADRLQVSRANVEQKLATTDADWTTYRGNNDRSSSSSVNVVPSVTPVWEYTPALEYSPTSPTSAGGLIFVSGDDGKVRALDEKSGEVRWQFATSSSIKVPPTIADGRAFVGCGDGHVYALEAATGQLLWRFRAAPVERHIYVYGTLSSTWPVNSGVLVEDGVAYFAAGIIDHDGTYVYAVDAKTGKLKWQNNSSGHLNKELRKGVSAQGTLTIQGDRLLLAGGNQISPAPFDLATGECLVKPRSQGRPQANHGRFVGVFHEQYAIAGGRILFSAAENVSTKGSFSAYSNQRALKLNFGGIPPAWDGKTLALVNFKHGKLTCCDAEKVAKRIEQGYPKAPAGQRRRRTNLASAFEADGAVRWYSDLGESNKFEAVSVAVCPNAVVAVVQYQQKFRAQPQWYIVAFNIKDGKTFWRHEIRSKPLPDGLLIDRKGQVVVTMLDGNVLCLGAK